jgi:hypothetical protein
MVDSLMNNELEEMWKEAAIARSKETPYNSPGDI